MKRLLLLFALFAMSMPAYPSGAVKMWGCAPPGDRRNALVLVDRGSRSYVKFSGQRVDAQLTTQRENMRWTWGNYSVVLTPDLHAYYYQQETQKAHFRCRRLGSR